MLDANMGSPNTSRSHVTTIDAYEHSVALTPEFSSISRRDFWFPDGDIVLAVDDYQFRIYRASLLCSTVFSDMLEMPPPSDGLDYVDGVPVVQLSDNVADWIFVLGWMYDSR
jgi:hypothetical protein